MFDVEGSLSFSKEHYANILKVFLSEMPKNPPKITFTILGILYIFNGSLLLILSSLKWKAK
jgi:hypothetical protein